MGLQSVLWGEEAGRPGETGLEHSSLLSLPLGPHGKLPLILQEACPEDGPGAVQHVYLLELSPRTCTSELHACLWLTHGRTARMLTDLGAPVSTRVTSCWTDPFIVM